MSILDMSADGGVILFRGQVPKKDFGLHLFDGKNGDVLFTFPRINVNEDVGFSLPTASRLSSFGPTDSAGITWRCRTRAARRSPR